MNYPRNGFMYDSNVQSLTALQVLRVSMTNPVSSGRKIICEAFSIPNLTNVATMGTLFVDPLTNAPSSNSLKPLPFLIGDDWNTPSNVGQFRVEKGTTRMSGNDIVTIPLKPSDRNYIEGAPFTILPGHVLAFQLDPGIIMDKVAFVMYTREENL